MLHQLHGGGNCRLDGVLYTAAVVADRVGLHDPGRPAIPFRSRMLVSHLNGDHPAAEIWLPMGEEPTYADDEKLITTLHQAMRWATAPRDNIRTSVHQRRGAARASSRAWRAITPNSSLSVVSLHRS